MLPREGSGRLKALYDIMYRVSTALLVSHGMCDGPDSLEDV